MALSKTHWKAVVSDPNFIGEADFEQGQELVLTIASVNKSETVVSSEGKSQKAVVHWAEKQYKPMILNVARSKSIEKVAKSGYFEDWVGVKVQLYIEHGIKAFGEVVSAVRVRPFPPKDTIIKCEECGNNITAAGRLNIEQVAEYTKQKTGRTLCVTCAKKIMDGAANQATEKTETTDAGVENG